MTDPLPDELGEDLTDDLEPGEDVDEFAGAYTAPQEEAPVTAEVTEAPTVGFYDAGLDLHALDDLTLAGRPGVLERLGPAHFRSKGFSFMGFLQTVYDHVAEELKKSNTPERKEDATQGE